jgi:hypothetical protein
MLPLLLAALLKEALYSGALRVFYICITVGYLELPELNNGRDIGINSAPYKQRSFNKVCCSWHKGYRWHIALAVVCK